MFASVLVADSDENLRELLKHVLEGAGYAVVSVADSVEAHKCLEQFEFDVVVCDVLFQGPSGTSFLTEVRQQTPQSEVIATTAHATLDAAIESLRAGVFDFLQKPFKALEVLSTVSRAVERRNLLSATALYKACQVIFDTRDPVQLPERVVRVAADIMRADSVALLLQRPEGDSHIAYSVGIKPGRAAENLLSLGEWIAQNEGNNRSPKLLPEDLGQDKRFVGVKAAVGSLSIIAFPLLSGERLIGILFLGREASSKAFRKNDIELVAVLASQVVLALENVRLLHQIVLTERLATVGQFAASVAHDIRNPLTYVHGNLMLLTEILEDLSRSKAGLPQAFEKFPSAIAEALVGADFITDLVSDIGKLARTNDQNQVSCDLNEAVRSAIRISGTTVRRKAVITTELGPDVVIVGNIGRVSQVFMNLLSNAAQAIDEPDGQLGEIKVITRRDGDQAFAEISDSGPGIVDEDLKRVFEPFFTTKPAGEGTGLGLSICRDIVNSYGGELSVESMPGSSTTFVASFKIAK